MIYQMAKRHIKPTPFNPRGLAWKDIDLIDDLAEIETEEEMALSAHQQKGLALLAVELENLGHGLREPVYAKACADLSMARPTLMRHLAKLRDTNRKQRSDAGNTTLSREEAEILSAYMMEGYRKNNRKITSLQEAVDVLRANSKIIAGRVDEETGQFFPMSYSAISAALKTYILHPDQLRTDTPATSLKSLHPNHVWQVDASVCVIYYLPDGNAELVELDQAEHYKNKPGNLKAIEQFRVIRYVLTDHTSGLIRYRYYPHAESGEHTVRFLAWAMAAKANKNDHFQGAPFIVMVDPGATGGGLVKRFCQRVGIKLIVNEAHNPRAKGSVEKANHIIETSFEQTLRYLKPRPRNFDELNAYAEQFQLWFNATQIHSRTKKTRLAVWMLIKPEQLRKTPAADILLTLATQEPESRKVQKDLTVNFKNRVWNVKDVPDVYIGCEVFVHWHPFIADTAMAVVTDKETGLERHIALTEEVKNEFGFKESAAVIGEEYKTKPDTIADTNRKAGHKLAAGESTQEATDKKRARKDYIAFDGAIDPLLESKQELPTFMPKRGTELELNLPQIDLPKLNHIQFAKFGKQRLGDEWSAELWGQLKRKFPEGATEPELEQWFSAFESQEAEQQPRLLRVV